MAIIDFFDRGWRINPKATAYIQDDRHFSFDEVGELSCRIAHGLLAAGFGRQVLDLRHQLLILAQQRVGAALEVLGLRRGLHEVRDDLRR